MPNLALQWFAEETGATPEAAAPGMVGSTDGMPAQQSGENIPQADTVGGERLTWEQIMADPEYNRRMQETVQARLRETRAAQEQLSQMQPLLDTLYQRFGTRDVNEISQSLLEDESYIEREAEKRNMPIDAAKAVLKAERDAATAKAQLEQSRREEGFRRVAAQAAQTKQLYPDFNFEAELQNAKFRQMTDPNNPYALDVKTAYEVIHHNELMAKTVQSTVQKTQQYVTNAVAANASRPAENTGNASGAIGQLDPHNLSKQTREDIRKRVRNGEKIVF